MNSYLEQQLLNESQAATWLGISKRTLWSLRAGGEIPFVRIGRAIRYDVNDLRTYVEKMKIRDFNA